MTPDREDGFVPLITLPPVGFSRKRLGGIDRNQRSRSLFLREFSALDHELSISSHGLTAQIPA
jgi:hypothetical protein